MALNGICRGRGPRNGNLWKYRTLPHRPFADRFARADPGRSRHTGGFGLGLSIVKAIVDAHGGTIDVETEEGLGSRFEIRLPAVEASVLPRRELEAAAGAEPAPAPVTRARDEDARRLAR